MSEKSIEREKARFRSGEEICVAWHYPGANGACVVMAGGFAVTKEPATDMFARRFNQAGFAVLAFDYRRLGESGGRPRQVVRVREALEDWEAAIAFAGTLPGVAQTKLALWAFSASGGHLFPVAARHPGLAAVIAQTPLVDAPGAMARVLPYSTPLAQLRLTGRGLLDAAGGLVGAEPRLVPLVGQRGEVAMLSTPDALDGDRALNPGNRYPDWRQAVAARSVLRLGFYRPGRHASSVGCPLLVVVCDDDRSAPPPPAIRAANRAPRGELARLPGGHYAPFMEAHEQAVGLEIEFLERHLLGRPATERAPANATSASNAIPAAHV
jgi:pimeloyl-ACP methyl ester carboxylesterase